MGVEIEPALVIHQAGGKKNSLLAMAPLKDLDLNNTKHRELIGAVIDWNRPSDGSETADSCQQLSVGRKCKQRYYFAGLGKTGLTQAVKWPDFGSGWEIAPQSQGRVYRYGE